MDPLALAVRVAAITFGGAVIGLVLKHVLPERLAIGPPQDAVASAVGLLTFSSRRKRRKRGRLRDESRKLVRSARRGQSLAPQQAFGG